MKTRPWMGTLALLALVAAPAASQQRQAAPPAGQERGGQDMMQMCHAMAGGGMHGSMMHGRDTTQARPGMREGMDRQRMAHPGMQGMQGMQGAQGMQGHEGMMEAMREALATSPDALLGAAEVLELTPEQRTRLQQMAETAEDEHHMQEAMSGHMKAVAALQGENPDLQAFEQALEEATTHMVEAHVAAARASVEARSVLTAEQRTKLQESMALMTSMKCGEMMGRAGDGAHH